MKGLPSSLTIRVTVLVLALLLVAVFVQGTLAANNAYTSGDARTTLADGVSQNAADILQTNTIAAPVVDPAPVYYHTYPGCAFQPGDSALTYSPLGAAIYATAIPPGGLSFRLRLDLPDGAVISQVDFYVVDNDSTNNMTLQLYRSQPAASVSQSEIGSITTAGLPTSAAVQTVSIYGAPTLTTVDNSQYAYYLRYGSYHYRSKSHACGRTRNIHYSGYVLANNRDSIMMRLADLIMQ